MSSCSGIVVKEVTRSKVYLKGTITGLSSGKRYCLHYFSGGWKNMPRSSAGYTYISGKTYFDLGGAGCYVPTSDLEKGKQFEVRCHEVERTCESRIVGVCSKVLWYEVTEQHSAFFSVRDENGRPVENAKIECAGEAIYTNSEGTVYRYYDAGYTYYATCYAPTGYECVDCYESFRLDHNKIVNFTMKGKAVAPAKHSAFFSVRDENGRPVENAEIECAAESFYTNSEGTVYRYYDAGYTYYATCYAPTGYECVDCYESFRLDHNKIVNFTMKAAEEEEIPPEPKTECKSDDKKPDKICVGGKWEDALCAEGTYTADRKKICRGGVWEDVSAEVPPAPECTEGYTKPGYVCRGGKWVPVGEEPEVRKYLTVAEANERVRTGLPCYIKCVLPILDMLPGIPYTPGAWIPPFCAITTEA